MCQLLVKGLIHIVAIFEPIVSMHAPEKQIWKSVATSLADPVQLCSVCVGTGNGNQDCLLSNFLHQFLDVCLSLLVQNQSDPLKHIFAMSCP